MLEQPESVTDLPELDELAALVTGDCDASDGHVLVRMIFLDPSAPRRCYTPYDMSRRTSRVLAVSVPPESAADFDKIAEEEGRNKSELFREMLRVYRAYRENMAFDAIQRYGASRARVKGVRTERDVERLIHEARGV